MEPSTKKHLLMFAGVTVLWGGGLGVLYAVAKPPVFHPLCFILWLLFLMILFAIGGAGRLYCERKPPEEQDACLARLLIVLAALIAVGLFLSWLLCF